MKIKIKHLYPGAVTPHRAHPTDAAYDLYTPQDYIVDHGRCRLPLGFALEIPERYCAEIQPRSGFSLKGVFGHDADVMYGLIDAPYRGEVCVLLNNHEGTFTIPAGTRIAQMLFRRVKTTEFELSEVLSHTDRSTGGFGSSGEQ